MMCDFDPSQIDNWADRHDARGQLPILIRKLLMTTLPDSNPMIDMPGGSSVSFRGWDGILKVDRGNSWAPDGVSGWEFSCNKNITDKANKDYEKRMNDPQEVNMETSTFVFVTPRRWNGKRSWVKERCEEGLWRDVRAYDADDLVAWLERSTDVSQWFAGILSGLPNAFQLMDKMDTLSVQMQSLNRNFDWQAKQPDPEPVQDSEHQETLDILDKAKDLIRQGLILTARTKLKEIEHEVTQLPDTLRFRYLTNLAFCELSEDKFDEAVSLIVEAHEIQPDNPTGITNASLAARLQQDYNQALDFAQRAIALNSDDPIAAANLISSLWDMGQNTQLENFITSNEWIINEPDSAEALAKIRMQQNRYEDAEAIYRSLVETNPDSPHVYAGLSQCLVAGAQRDRTSTLYSEDLERILNEAESMASIAIGILQPTQLVARRHEALLLRAYARSRLDKTVEAMHDADSVLNESPGNSNAIQQKGILLLKEGRADEARNLLESIQDSDIRANSLLPLADACLESGDAITAITLLKDSFSLNPPEWEDLGRAQSLMRAESKVGRDDSVGPMLEAALDRHPCDPILFVLFAVRSSLKGDTEATASALIKAISLADNPLGRMLQSQLGHLYEEVGQFSDAAEQFSKVCGDDITHPDAIPMLLSLSNSGQYRRALDVAKRFREEMDSPPRIVLNVEAQILGYVGDVKTAVLRYREMCSRTDSTTDDLVGLAITQFRCGEHSSALETIVDIDVSGLGHNPQSLMRLAHMKRLLGVSGYINDAYLSRRYGLNDPNIQMGYFALFLSVNRDWEEPSVVEPDCLVLIRTDEEEKWWHIVEDTESPRNDRELSPDNELSQLLLGRSVGDVFDLQQGLGKITCEIVGLQSKYVRAFQEICEEFPMRFPGNPSLSRVKMDNNNFTPIFHSVELRHQHVENVEMLYESRQLPFVSFCSFIGNSTLLTWLDYTEQPNKQFWFGEGSVQEANEGAKLLRDADTVTLDITALLTVHRLKLSDHLQTRFSCVSIPQFVFDEIQEEFFQMKLSNAPIGFVGKNNEGRYTLTEISESTWRNWKRHVSSVFELSETFERIPSYPRLSVDDPQEVVEMFGLGGAGAVYLGGEEFEADPVLISDDLVLSNLVRSSGTGVANSQALLVELLRSGIVTEETYSSKIEELALMNYWFIRVRAKDILRSLESNNYQTSPGVQQMLKTLRGPDCSENVATIVATEVVYGLARTTLLYDQFELLLLSVLTEIRSGRHSNSILWRFRNEISFRLRYIPLKHDHTLQVVDSLLQISPQ